MALLIDTDLLVDLERAGGPDGLDALLGDEAISISVITVSELLQGVLRASGARRARRRAFVEPLLAELDPIPITEPVARVHAEIWSQLASSGSLIGAHDLWIAATGLVHDLGIATRNSSHFGRVPGLRVVAPDPGQLS